MALAKLLQPGKFPHGVAAVLPQLIGKLNLDPPQARKRLLEQLLIARRIGQQMDRLVSIEVLSKAANA
jgi:hypothetical protein